MAAAPEHQNVVQRLTINGEKRDVAATSLADLLLELGYGGQKVATAVNGDFVAERARGGARLSAGDQVEIVSPRQGG